MLLHYKDGTRPLPAVSINNKNWLEYSLMTVISFILVTNKIWNSFNKKSTCINILLTSKPWNTHMNRALLKIERLRKPFSKIGCIVFRTLTCLYSCFWNCTVSLFSECFIFRYFLKQKHILQKFLWYEVIHYVYSMLHYIFAKDNSLDLIYLYVKLWIQ